MRTGGGSAAGAGWRSPSPRLRVLRRVEVASAAVVVLVALVVVEVVDAATVGVLAASAAAVMVVGLGLEALLSRRVGAWGYVERDDDLVVRRGLLVRRLSVIPYGRMQFVELTAGPFERAFGLSTVRMHTAAAASDARIPGLNATEAERLRDRLTMLGEARAAGL